MDSEAEAPCYILLPVYNRRAVTERFIADLNQQTYENIHLILIDDGSEDGTAEMVQSQMVQSQIANLTILRGVGNWWWAGSLQQGLNWLKQQNLLSDAVVLMINDDVRIAPSFVATGMRLLAERPHSLLQAEGNELLDRGVQADLEQLTFEPAPSPGQINCLTTRGLFLCWTDLKRIGDFHPRWLPHYLSDFEFTIRAHRRGLALCTHPDLSLQVDITTTGLHELNQVTPKSLWQRYFSRRSSSNKLDWTAFIFLACPWWRWLPLLLKVWLAGISKLWRHE